MGLGSIFLTSMTCYTCLLFWPDVSDWTWQRKQKKYIYVQVAYGFSPHFSCSGTVQTTIVLGDYPDHHRAQGLSRPLSCSRTVPTTIVYRDCPNHYCARGLFRSLSCSGTVPTTLRTLLEDSPPRLHVICTHIQLRGIYLDLATRLIPSLPASSGTTSVRCTCRCISYCLYDDWILNFSGNSF